MKHNPVNEKLKRGQPSFGTWLSLGDLYATRVLARLGFDWLTLDIEHSAIDRSAFAQPCRLTMALIQIGAKGDVQPFGTG